MRALTLSVSVLALAWAAGPAAADSPNLKGSYAFTGSGSCLVAPGHVDAPAPLPTNPMPGQPLPLSGFNDRLQPNDIAAGSGANQNSFTRSFSVEGIRTFDGNGHGTVKGSVVGHDGRPTPGPNGWPHFPPSASSGDFSYEFTYAVDGNGGWTADMVPGTYQEKFTSGPRFTPNQQTATVDAIPEFTGAISNDGKTLVASHTATAVETITYSNGDVWPAICERSRVFIKLQD